ncbi:serine/arginine repetitive matrix protein 1-like [Octopus sinensis]|uniref:Serine/arginine repetitive matrix protein 1-like n=1 Tax=Octopus sinensis TaxID=2607531 RepID=A0A6P7U0D3_9MOLL|nr:serine/arginine repetitive matrix protein 1-like [Octopus sinensis]
MQFPSNIDRKVTTDQLILQIDMSCIKLDTIKPWITKRITEILGMEDDVVICFICNLLDEKNVDPREIQISITGFLNHRNARLFIEELWDLLISAMDNNTGIPTKILEEKKFEIAQRMEKGEEKKVFFNFIME